MPNWCENSINIIGNKKDIKEFIQKINPKKQSFDVLNLNNPKKEPWKINNIEFFENETHLEYFMDSAWDFPRDLINELTRQFPKLTFEVHYEEETMMFIGFFSIKNNKEIDSERVDYKDKDEFYHDSHFFTNDFD